MAELVVRVQWSGGFVDVSDGGSGRRRTIPFNAGADVQTEAAAEAVGEAVLESLGPQDSIEAEVGDSSFWPELGDAVKVPGFSSTATARLVARRVSTDRNGAAVLSPTLGSRSQIFEERQKLAIDRLASGVAGGRSAGTAPSVSIPTGLPTGSLSPVSIPVWTLHGVREDAGPLWEADRATIATKITILMTDTAPDDDITIGVYLNGAAQVAYTLAQGETEFSALGSLLITPGDQLQVRCTSIGTNDEDDLEDHKLTVQFTAAPGELQVSERRVR